MKIIYTDDVLAYEQKGHPESPERLKKAYDYLKENHEIIGCSPASYDDIARVHDTSHVDNVRQGTFFDPDTPAHENIYRYARLSAGAAIEAQKRSGFSLARPPGHHAGRDFLGGFCYFNNLAIAVKRSNLKTLIVDFDGHHGNGTEDIFARDENVFYLSLHRIGIFPGTGEKRGPRVYNHGFTSVPGDKHYLEVFDEALATIDLSFEQIAVSAGFDAHADDPLASLGLTEKAYRKIGERLSAFDVPLFSVMEGGYVAENLGPLISAYIEGLRR